MIHTYVYYQAAVSLTAQVSNLNLIFPASCLPPFFAAGAAQKMASDDPSDEDIFEALRVIPDNLRGTTWLTTSQLALVAGVTETALNAVLKPLKANSSDLQRIMIDKSMPHSAGGNHERTAYYRPYTYMTSVVSNRMKGSEDDVKVAMPHPSLPGYYVFLTFDNVHILKSLGNALESSGKPLKRGARWLTKTCKALDGPGDKEYMFSKSFIRADWYRGKNAAQADRSYVPIQSDFIRKLKDACFNMTPWSRMNVSLQMKILSATVSRNYEDKNPALAWYTGACNDIMDQFNGQVGRTRQARLGAISAKNMGPLNRLEEIFAEFLDWKAETRDAGFPMKYLAATTHSNLRQSILGFTAMCRFYIDKFPGVAIPQWRVNDDAIEHHFRNMRDAAEDNTNPAVQRCCAATCHATAIRLFSNTAVNCGLQGFA